MQTRSQRGDFDRLTEKRRPDSLCTRIEQNPLQCLACRKPIEPGIGNCPQHGKYRGTDCQVMTCASLFSIHKGANFERTKIGSHISLAEGICWHTIAALTIRRSRPRSYFLAKSFIGPQQVI